MNNIALVMPYYMNKSMLVKQFEILNSYPDEVKQHLEVVIVDDGSPIGWRAEEVIAAENLSLPGIKFQLFRVLVDLPWNQHGARNIGAVEAKSQFLLLTDMDHIVSPKLMTELVNMDAVHKAFYMFERINWHDRSPKNPHPNTFFMTRKFFWKTGGYDESFCGIYGTDGHFHRQCLARGKQLHIKTPLQLVGRDSIPDASTFTMARKEGRDPNATKDIQEAKARRGIRLQTFRLLWKKIL